MRTAMKSERDLSRTGQERAIASSVATALTKEIKEFLEDQSPLMTLMSSPGIKKVLHSSPSLQYPVCTAALFCHQFNR